MQDKKKEFYLISILSAYLFIRDKYSDLVKIDGEDQSENIKLLTNRLSELSKHAFLPNKTKIIEQSYQDVFDKIDKSSIDEERFFELVTGQTTDLTHDDRVYILNCVIYVAHHNDKISNSEKETLIQVAHFIGLDSDFKAIMKAFNNSEFSKKIPLQYKLIPGVVVLLLVIGLSFFWTKKINDQVNIFDQKSVVFNEVSFNRMVVYKNKFNVSNRYSLKQVLFYVHGNAEISFDPSNLEFDQVSNRLIYWHKDENVFDLTLNARYTVVDQLDPEPIDRSDAAKISAVVGVAGAVAGGVVGNKLGGMIGTILPANASLVGTIGGAAIGGAGTAYLAFTTLDGLQITKELSQREESEVIANAKSLISALMLAEPELEAMFKSNFESYIKEAYLSRGLDIGHIEYRRIAQ